MSNISLSIEQLTNALQKLLPDIQHIEYIDHGGFKTVFLVDLAGTKEALKAVFIPSDPDDPTLKAENLKRISREIGLIAACTSPFLVKLGSIDPMTATFGDSEYFIYSEEYLEGQSIRKLLKAGEVPEFITLLSLAHCGTSVIEELWGNNVLHRDIKPNNVMAMDDDSRPFVLIDLGIAFIVDGSRLTPNPLGIPGTRSYLAPEMFRENFREFIDDRTDIYALGLTIYEYACNTNPFYDRSDNSFNTYRRIQKQQPEPLYSLRPDLPPQFCSLIDQTLKKTPALRPNLESLRKSIGELS